LVFSNITFVIIILGVNKLVVISKELKVGNVGIRNWFIVDEVVNSDLEFDILGWFSIERSGLKMLGAILTNYFVFIVNWESLLILSNHASSGFFFFVSRLASYFWESVLG